MLNKRRYVNQQIWKESPIALIAGVSAFVLSVSCMFLTVGLATSSKFLLYTPLIAAAMFLLNGYYEKHPIPQAVSWGLAWIIIAFSGLLGVIGAIGTENGLSAAWLVCFGLLILPTGAVGYAIWKAMLSYRQAITDSLDQMMIDLVELRHEVSFDEVMEELQLGKSDILHRAEQLQENGRISGTVDPSSERLYSLTGLAQKQTQIASVIQARGQIRLPELSQEMKVPEALLRQWLYQLVRLGHFSGYVDWESETIFSRQREALQKEQTCPNCAAELNLVGQGIVGCQYCQAEIFI